MEETSKGCEKMRDKVSKDRWLLANEQERKGVGNAEDMKEWLRVRRYTWPNLISYLRGYVTFDGKSKILEIGGGPTSIFLAIGEGERYMVDPNWSTILQANPFMGDVVEYGGVTFISSAIEDVAIDKKFNLIFTINTLDHVADLEPTVNKINELLEPAGYLIVIVDCYADSAVRNIMSFFDIDLPHPHHFLTTDVLRLFSSYEFIKQDDRINELINGCSFRGQKKEIAIYRVDKLFARMWMILKSEGRERDIVFISKYMLCYGLSLLIAAVNRRESPIHPLKKDRLFIFRK